MSTTSPSNFPAGIPVSREHYENWALMIKLRNAWTCVPRNADDVVAVCNWAASAGFTVRPRGIMHGWSPLTVEDKQSTDTLMLVDTSQLDKIWPVDTAQNGQPAQVRVQTGATMDQLMIALEDARGGSNGFSFAHIPAPGHITVGGALAINAHGSAVPGSPNDDFDIPYGSLSNLILGFTAVVTLPGTTTYVAQTFVRGEGDDRAFLTHCGRAFLLDVTLQVTENYYLQCQSFMNIANTTLFAEPSGPTPPAGSVGAYLEQSGRIEIIWFPAFPTGDGPPPVSYPWLKVWTVAPAQPSGSRLVTEPYNYPFSDNLPTYVTSILKLIVAGAPSLTPTFTSMSAAITAAGLEGTFFSQPTDNLWGLSKNTLLYVKDTTLRVTANGYAVLMKKDQVQKAIADFATKFSAMLGHHQARKKWPINSPLEIRVTALDDPAKIVVPGQSPTSTVISSLSIDPVVESNGWDVACWFDVLTVIPKDDPEGAYRFYEELETWFFDHFGSGFRVCPEWSKGWAYTASGAWTNPSVLQNIRDTFTTGRASDDTWQWEVATLAKYDAANLFSNPFLDTLFTP